MHDSTMNHGHNLHTNGENNFSNPTGFNLDSEATFNVEHHGHETWDLTGDNKHQQGSSDFLNPVDSHVHLNQHHHNSSDFFNQIDHHKNHEEPKFGTAGRCWSCSGTGVQWSGGQNVKCWSCGGSGVGAR